MSALHTFKRGDTLRMAITVTTNGQPQDCTHWGVRSQLRAGNKLIADLELEWADREAGEFMLFDLQTESFPVGTIQCDIEYTLDNGDIVSTETFEVECVADVTR